MKKGMGGAKGILFLLLIAVVVCGGVLDAFPEKSRAAAVKVKYNVEILDVATPYDMTNPTVNNESPTVFSTSINNGEPLETRVTANEGITFQMQVDTKAKTETLKVGKTRIKATYYPVTILRNSFKAPDVWYQVSSGEDVHNEKITTTMIKDAKGKLYISGGDVDVSQVMGEKTLKTQIGDGTVDPAGSLTIPIALNNIIRIYSYREQPTLVLIHMLPKKPTTTTWTTGQNRILVKGSKSGLEGKAFPDDDSTGLLPNPLVGVPLDLAAGTGTLVSTDVSYKVPNALGMVDFLRGGIWVMKITPASK